MSKSVSMKTMKNYGRVVLGVPYTMLQHTLNYESRDSYNATMQWNCDHYILNGKYSIATGYNYGRACTYDVTTDKQLLDDLNDLEQLCTGNNDMGRDERRDALIKLMDKHFGVTTC